MKPSASAWSFGKESSRLMSRTTNLANPGPGQYDYSNPTKFAAPRWRIGTEKRTGSKFNENPGPGQYTSSIIGTAAPKYTMRPKTANVNDPMRFVVSPGPGNYTPNYGNKAAAYSMRIKPQTSKETTYVPGPGQYSLRKEADMKVPSYKFGHEEKCKNTQSFVIDNPGPGQYATPYSIGTAPKYSMGKEVRGASKNSEVPGPGQYTSSLSNKHKAPVYSISSVRPKTAGNTYVPGPGQYTATMTDRPKSPSYKIGTGNRGNLTAGEAYVPGPGQYTPGVGVNRPKSPNWKMGTASRISNKNDSDYVPGPGNYNVTKGIGDGPKYSMKGKTLTKNSDFTPGPGQYEGDKMNHLSHNPTWKIGTGSRDNDLKYKIRENTPGPGMYGIKDGDNGPKYRFGTERRGVSGKVDTPGPGQYYVPCTMANTLQSPYNYV